MSEQFKVGDVCIWQNLTGKYAVLNGEETTIIRERDCGYSPQSGKVEFGPMTDTVFCGVRLGALPFELRKKRPPESDEAAYRQAMLDCISKAKQPHRVPA